MSEENEYSSMTLNELLKMAHEMRIEINKISHSKPIGPFIDACLEEAFSAAYDGKLPVRNLKAVLEGMLQNYRLVMSEGDECD